MTREVDWGDIGGSKGTPKTKPTKMTGNKPMREVDWGDLSSQSGSNFASWFQKHFVEPVKATKGANPLETAGNLMNLFVNRPIEMTGAPSAARGFFQGGENLIRGVGNLPADISSLFGHTIEPKNFPGTQQQIYPIPKATLPGPQGVNPYIQETAETIGSLGSSLPAMKGYQAIKSGLQAAKVPEYLSKLLAGTTTGYTLAPDNRAVGAGLGAGAEVAGSLIGAGKNFIANRNPSATRNAYLEAQLELERQKASEESAKAISKEHFGKNTPEALELNAKEKERQVMENEKRQNAYNAENKMLPGEQTVPEVEHRLENIDQAIRQHLGEGEPHSLQLSERVSNAIEGIPETEPHPVTGYPRQVRKGGLREEIGSQYDKLADTFPDKIKLPDKVNVAGIQKEFDQFLKDFPNIAETTKEEFRQLAAKTHPKIPGEEINPRAFFRAYRAMKQQEGSLRSKARTFGTSLADAETLNKKADSLKHTYEEMQDIIEKHFPKDSIKELHRINHEYSTLVAPLNKNKVYINMLESGRVPGNILEKISGRQKGNSILRNMIMQDPELSRLALGHSYADNPAHLLRPNQTIAPYIEANPQVAELLNLQRQGIGNLESARQNELIVSQFKNLPKLRAEYNRQRAMAKRLRDEAETTGLSKQEAIKRKLAYEEAQRKLNSFIKKALGTSLTGAIGGYTVKKLLE